MNEVIYDNLDKNNICEVLYFDDIIAILDKQLDEYSFVVTVEYDKLPVTKYKKIVFLIGENSWNTGIDIYKGYTDVVAVFRDYCIPDRYDDKFIFPIPSGYNCRSNGKVMTRMYPEKPIKEREYDIFYSGQKLPWREVLVKRLVELSSSYKIYSQATSSFRQGIDIDDYYQLMGNSKICVVPDGTSIDTYRFTEACGSGCIVITTPKPDLWYYLKAPIYYVKDWGELTKEYLDNILLELTESMEYRQGLINKYYTENLTAEATANYVLKVLESKQ